MNDTLRTLSPDSIKKLDKCVSHLEEPGPLLNDEIVNFGVLSMGFKSPVPGELNQDVMVHSQSLCSEINRYKVWIMQGRRGIFVPAKNGVVRHQSISAVQSLFGQSFGAQKSVRKVAFPLFESNHWSLLILDRDLKTFRFYESLGITHRHMAYTLRDMLRDADWGVGDWTIVAMNCGKQQGGWECGYSAIACSAHELGKDVGTGSPVLWAAESRTEIAFLSAFVGSCARANQDARIFQKRLRNYIRFQ